ncbi:hypothetical protein [Pseudoduganella chitinolytica]|uniref:Uncharacterized protein n=1 Tax=Pseudoduganella chitinolytica TaxID=34070 RepID=A0ABY8BG62_9BURK|nr:hypothetical protein [Pseudoduganella chitinolytica]WEF34921.1 hypothetical protein PX653_09215 [Pseudoduganella chitinolytica]
MSEHTHFEAAMRAAGCDDADLRRAGPDYACPTMAARWLGWRAALAWRDDQESDGLPIHRTNQSESAWRAVCAALDAAMPGWIGLENVGKDSAVSAIAMLARAHALREARTGLHDAIHDAMQTLPPDSTLELTLERGQGRVAWSVPGVRRQAVCSADNLAAQVHEALLAAALAYCAPDDAPGSLAKQGAVPRS